MVVGSLKLWTDLVVEGFQKSLSVAKFLCLLHATNAYVCTPITPYGPSMLPTLNLTGDLVLVERVSTWLGKVGRGDMVLLRSTEDPRKVVIKRIMGMEGDTVTYLVDPKNSDASKTCVVPRETYGYKETTCIILEIHELLGLCPMVLWKENCSGGYGHSRALALYMEKPKKIHRSFKAWKEVLLLRRFSPI